MDILLTSAEITERLKISEGTFKKIRSQPGFPRPVMLTPTSHPRWREGDIAAWLEEQ